MLNYRTYKGIELIVGGMLTFEINSFPVFQNDEELSC